MTMLFHSFRKNGSHNSRLNFVPDSRFLLPNKLSAIAVSILLIWWFNSIYRNMLLLREICRYNSVMSYFNKCKILLAEKSRTEHFTPDMLTVSNNRLSHRNFMPLYWAPGDPQNLRYHTRENLSKVCTFFSQLLSVTSAIRLVREPTPLLSQNPQKCSWTKS